MLAMISKAISALTNALSLSLSSQHTPKRVKKDKKRTLSLKEEDPRCVLFFCVYQLENTTRNNHHFTQQSWNLSCDDTMKMLLHCRDCRNGKGFRDVSYESFIWVRKHAPITYLMNMIQFIEVGCFKDLLALAVKADQEGLPIIGDKTYIELEYFAECIKQALILLEKGQYASISLAAKWAPSENKKYGHYVKIMSKLLGMNLKEYRQTISKLRAHLPIVEHQMCANDWDGIDVSQVPKSAREKHQKVLKEKCQREYSKYVCSIKEHKCNDNKESFDREWFQHTLVLVSLNPNRKKHTKDCWDLGMKIAEAGYKSVVSAQKPYELIPASTAQINSASSFDLDELFALCLQVTPCPKTILIISDVSIEKSCKSAFASSNKKRFDTAFERAADAFESRGTPVPTVVYWNTESTEETLPIVEYQPGLFLMNSNTQSHKLVADMYAYHDVTQNKLWDFVSSCVQRYKVETEELEKNVF